MRCPPHLHETFWVAHRTPSHANLATILSRIILLAESRVLLFDLLKACMGNPSPRLLTRMLEDSKRKQEEKVANADLFARLNYFGQSSDQIRARARATTAISAATSTASSLDAKSLPKDLDELRQLIRGTSQEGSILPEKSYLPRNSQILKPSQMIQLPGMTSDDTSQPFFKRFLSSKVPSMEMITEDFEEEEDEDEDIFDTPENNDMVDGDAEKPNHEVDERTRQESIRKFVQARFSGRDSGSNVSTISRTLTPSFTNPSNSFCFNDNDAHPTPSVSPPPEPVALSATPFSPSIAPKHRASKRVSMQCVHPKLLEKICLEWMASVPWQVFSSIISIPHSFIAGSDLCL